jgi:hypothetical protein
MWLASSGGEERGQESVEEKKRKIISLTSGSYML